MQKCYQEIFFGIFWVGPCSILCTMMYRIVIILSHRRYACAHGLYVFVCEFMYVRTDLYMGRCIPCCQDTFTRCDLIRVFIQKELPSEIRNYSATKFIKQKLAFTWAYYNINLIKWSSGVCTSVNIDSPYLIRCMF